MNIFNSLGSNYNLKFVLSTLFAQNRNSYSSDLKKLLEERYHGRVILTYKGREAIGTALNILNFPKDTAIAINGFTCFAVYETVEKSGYKAECLDLGNNSLNFSAKTLLKRLKQNPKIKAVIIQNTLGYPCDIEEIAKACRENDLVLIEDLAHCVGAKYLNDQEAGRVGDFVTLSFSQDKMIDAVSGGALIIRNKKYNNSTIQQFNNLGNKQQLIDRLYPLFTFKIRKTYGFILGKVIHVLLKAFNLLSKPMSSDFYKIFSLPNWYCRLALTAFADLSSNLTHRRMIAEIYKRSLGKKVLWKNITGNISLSSNLRFPIFVKSRGKLLKFLKNHSIHLSDIWYDDVSSQCPKAVSISKTILNLPTHRNVSKENALYISFLINLWLKSQ